MPRKPQFCKGRMREDLGYNAVSPTAQGILDRTYEYPEDFDAATRELCEECALIRLIIHADSVGTKMTKEDFMAHWKRATEETSSLHSGLTFSHYMAEILLPYISHFHALKVTLLFHTTGTKVLSTRALSYATKRVRLLSYHQTMLRSTHVSRL